MSFPPSSFCPFFFPCTISEHRNHVLTLSLFNFQTTLLDPETGKERKLTVLRWNPTLANLSLMALGSSAPEIMLAVIEAVGSLDLPPSDGLGTFCIVGSAAFNLLAISALCVAAIPDGEKREIEGMGVFGCTAFFSIFAYVWLILVVMDNKVTLLEAYLTVFFFVLLLALAYGQDIGWKFGGGVQVRRNVSIDRRKEGIDIVMSVVK